MPIIMGLSGAQPIPPLPEQVTSHTLCSKSQRGLLPWFLDVAVIGFDAICVMTMSEFSCWGLMKELSRNSSR